MNDPKTDWRRIPPEPITEEKLIDVLKAGWVWLDVQRYILSGGVWDVDMRAVAVKALEIVREVEHLRYENEVLKRDNKVLHMNEDERTQAIAKAARGNDFERGRQA